MTYAKYHIKQKEIERTKKRIKEGYFKEYYINNYNYQKKNGSLWNKGKNNPNWKGGISFLYHTEREILMSQSKYKIWRELVFIRDNWTCQECELRGIYLHVHHIKPWKNNPEFRFDVNNGQTLCKSCHIDIHKQIKLKAKAGGKIKNGR